jgi:dCMP deaminase
MLSQIKNLVECNTDRLDWDDYFMSIALIASQRSPCKRLKVGSVVVNDMRLISMGYNGFISGAKHISRVKDNHEQSIIHSEINAITDCAKRGTSLSNSKIYVTHYPCLNCFRAIAASNIKEIVYLYDYNNDEMVATLALDSGIIIRKIEKKESFVYGF